MIFGQKPRPRVRLREYFRSLKIFCQKRRPWVSLVSVTDDFWPKAQAAGQASEKFQSRMIFGQKSRPRERPQSSFGHL